MRMPPRVLLLLGPPILCNVRQCVKILEGEDETAQRRPPVKWKKVLPVLRPVNVLPGEEKVVKWVTEMASELSYKNRSVSLIFFTY